MAVEEVRYEVDEQDHREPDQRPRDRVKGREAVNQEHPEDCERAVAWGKALALDCGAYVEGTIGAWGFREGEGSVGSHGSFPCLCLYMEVEYTTGTPRETRGGGWLDGCYGDRALHFLLDCTP